MHFVVLSCMHGCLFVCLRNIRYLYGGRFYIPCVYAPEKSNVVFCIVYVLLMSDAMVLRDVLLPRWTMAPGHASQLDHSTGQECRSPRDFHHLRRSQQ